jgi:hypothetical protein
MIERTVLRLIIAMGVPLASAVVMDQLPKTGVAEVPFAFQVDEQTLPAGSYSVKQADGDRSVQIQSQKMTGASVKCVAVKREFGKAQEPRLVFESYEGRYFLSEIWFETDGRGLILRNASVVDDGASNAAGGIRYVRFR